MTPVKKFNLVSIDEYLTREMIGPGEHEYLGGIVYEVACERGLHNVIAGNVFAALHVRLRDRRYQPIGSDTKVRIRLSTEVRCYYPDVFVICRPNPPEDDFQDEPTVIIEVLSRSTRRIDEGEKRDAYLTIASLSVYALVEQETPAIVVFRPSEQGFVREVYEGLDAVLPLGEIETELPLAEVYEAAQFVAEPVEENPA